MIPDGRNRVVTFQERSVSLKNMERTESMKFLLTSGGISNNSIRNALVDMLGKPIAESSALCIPTAIYAIRNGLSLAWNDLRTFRELGWKEFGVLELTTLPSIKKELWVSQVQGVDALIVGGGDPLYLCYWMQQSGLADLLPELGREKVYMGMSAGSMVLTPQIGEEFVGWKPPEGDDRTLGIVDFSLFPHLDYPLFPQNSMANAEKWAGKIRVPSYAIDDQTAIKVVDGVVEVISEGHWKQFS
jgi:dipeptidase E